MDDTAKMAVACTVIGTLFSATLPSVECGRSEMCAIENPEAPHTHQEKPEPLKEGGVRVVAFASASSSIGEYTLLRRGEQRAIFFKK